MCKKLIHLVSLVAVLSTAGTASADLVAHWTFDEGSGTTAFDSSGNGHDGTINGTANWVPGQVGGAFHFDGSTYVAVADEIGTFPTFSIAAWFKYDSFIADWNSIWHNNAWQSGWLHHMVTNYAGQDVRVQFAINGAGDQFGVTPIETDVWYHSTVTYDSTTGQMNLYLTTDVERKVNLDVALTVGGPATILTAGQIGGWDGNRLSSATYDDIRMYDHILSEAEILSAVQGKPWPFAFGPSPEDGSILEATWVNMSWQPGQLAVSHDVYMGDNFDDVNNGTAGAFQGNLGLTTTSLLAGFFGYPFPDGLVPGTTYYWRVDEVNDANPNSPWKGNVWSFWVPPRIAYNPSPVNDTKFATTDVALSWTPGFGAILHNVYFGDNFDEVSNAAGAPPSVNATFNPGALEMGKTYYWRVDESAPPLSFKGEVWSFTTVPDVPVTDPDLLGWWTLDEGAGTTAVDWSGHGAHGSFVGDPQWIDGHQGMALEFAGGSAANPEYVDFGNPGSLQLFDTVTISAWVKMNPGNAGVYMGIGGKLISGVYKGYALVRHSSNVFRLWCDDGAGVLAGHEASSNLTYTDTDWHHVVGVVDNGTSSLYVDGVKQVQQGAVDLTDSGGIAYIGKQYGDNSSHRYWNGLIDDVRIYGKALTDAQIAEVMLGDKKLAGSPVPDRNAVVDIRDISSLSWSRGDTAASHDVYLGTDRDAVAGADNSAPEFRGNQAGTSLSLSSLVEFGGGDYYWRIDEVAADGTASAGTIWKFTVPGSLIVDNFESYNNLDPPDAGSNRIFDSWLDGFGTATNGALSGNELPPYAETSIVHGGAQSMIYRYDNAGKTSEATMTLASKKDWTVQGVTKLSLWLKGASANAADRMYVALNGTAVVYHDDPAATQISRWTEWVIDLSAFGVDLTNVNSISIGVGTRNAPAAGGGAGTVHIDDIGLVQ